MLARCKVIFIIVAAGALGAAVLFARNKSDVDREVTDAIAILKQDNDRRRDCEAFDRLVALSVHSKRATLMVAEMYARGLCKKFDLSKAIEWYQKGTLSGVELGHALFQNSMWEMPSVNDYSKQSEHLTSLLKKSKELGFQPSEAEINRLPPQYKAIFL